MSPILERGASYLATLNHAGGPYVKAALKQVSQHTGIPVLLVAAIACVMSWRLAKRSIRFIVEVSLAFAVILALSELGWIRW